MAVVFAAMAVGLLGWMMVAWLHPPGPATATFYDAAMGDYLPLVNTIGIALLPHRLR